MEDDRVEIARRTSKWFSDQVVFITDGAAEHIDFHDDALRQVMEPHIEKCRRKRAEVLQDYPPHLLSHIVDSLGPLTRECYLSYDASMYPLRETFYETLFGTSICRSNSDSPPILTQLQTLHTRYSRDYGKKKHRREKFEILKPLLDINRRQRFHRVYQNFVHDVILPNVHATVTTEETTVYYQCFPCVRVVRPGEFSIGAHADVNYGHSPANINYYVPLTEIYGSNSLHLESSPGKEDWHSIKMRRHDDDDTTVTLNNIFRFHGSMCSHFTTENCTDMTRISLDFRIVLGSLINLEVDSGNHVPNNYSDTPGYYLKAQRDVETGQWRCVEEDDDLPRDIDDRVGFPFTFK